MYFTAIKKKMPEREELHLNGFQICSDWRPARRPIPANIFDHEREINLCCVRHQKKKKRFWFSWFGLGPETLPFSEVPRWHHCWCTDYTLSSKALGDWAIDELGAAEELLVFHWIHYSIISPISLLKPEVCLSHIAFYYTFPAEWKCGNKL